MNNVPISITSLQGKLQGKRVLVRAGLNVPIENGQITDVYRLQNALQTITFLRNEGAKIILCGHIGREPIETLEPVKRVLQNKMPVIFVKDVFAEDVEAIVSKAATGGVVLFENLRRWNGEKENDSAFAKRLASCADIYVNDAFPVCHREHASITMLPTLLPSYAGIQLEKEVSNLQKAFEPTHPFLFILGGAKVETKMPLISSFIGSADTLFVGGVLANDFFRAQNIEIGISKHSDMLPENLKDVVNHITLPIDVIVERDKKKTFTAIRDIQKEDSIFDAGPDSIALLVKEIQKASLIVWNGPLGFCEGGYCDATLRVADAISKSTAYSVVGGGDTLAAVPDDVQNKMSFISTGGGAMLTYLAEKQLVGITALLESQNTLK